MTVTELNTMRAGYGLAPFEDWQGEQVLAEAERPTLTGLPPECHRTDPVDPDAAMRAVRALCGG